MQQSAQHAEHLSACFPSSCRQNTAKFKSTEHWWTHADILEGCILYKSKGLLFIGPTVFCFLKTFLIFGIWPTMVHSRNVTLFRLECGYSFDKHEN